MPLTSYIQKARRVQQNIQADAPLQTHLLWVLFLRTVLYTLLLATGYFFETSPYDIIHTPLSPFFVLAIAVYGISIFSALYLLIFQGNRRRFGLIQVLLDTLFASLLIFFTGTSLSHFTIVYFFPIITAGLLFPIKGGLLTAAIVSLQLAFLLFLESQRILFPALEGYGSLSSHSVNNILNLFTSHGLLFFLTALLSIFFGQRLRRTETALSDSLQKFDVLSQLYKKIFDSISTGIITLDTQQRISSANPAIGSIIGGNPLEIIGRQAVDVFPEIELQNEQFRQTMNFRRQTGESRRIGYSHMSMVQEKKEGEEVAREMIITMRDITELENLERQVRQAEKLAAIGTMSASIAHDFRNPLTAISGSAQILAADFREAPERYTTQLKLTEIIQREANRLITTIGDFLKFARPERLQSQWLSLSNSLEEVITMLKAGNNLPETVTVTTDFAKELAVWSDKKQLFTLLTHLIQNSIPFCPEGREQIKIQGREKPDGNSAEEQSSWTEIIVADNGTGIQEIPPELIFQPFHTTRADGTGLGLAIVHQIVKDNHGTISVSNSGLPNEQGSYGACFTIRLPLPDDAGGS